MYYFEKCEKKKRTTIGQLVLLAIYGHKHDNEIKLRTVPTFVTAHTFCASRDTRASYGWCLLIQEYFCAVQNYAEKQELCKCSWYPKRKSGLTMHFSEIRKLQFEKKKRHTLLFILLFFFF